MIVPSRIRYARAFALALLSLLLAVSAHAALPAGVTQGPTVEGITEYRLANGLAVLLFPDASQPKTTVNVTYRVGSAHENYGETGMAHLLEHLVFKGTPSRGNIMQELGRRGMSFNGSTSFDRTNYFQSFTASDENLDWALRDGGGPDGQLVHPAQRPRLRNDGGAQRVRERARTTRRSCCGAGCWRPPTSGTTTGTSRSARAPTSRTSTSAACRRSTSCTTSRTTRC